jgi:hypothetical protein
MTGKDENLYVFSRYTILKKDYIIHTSSSEVRFLVLRCLKKEGVKPVIFLNWLDKCATLL